MRGPALVALALAVVAVALAVAPLAAAQGAGADVQVRVIDLPEEPLVVRSNSSESADFSVNLEASNFACTEEGTLPVALSLEASPGAPDTFAVDPGRLNFTASPGTHGGTSPYNETMPATFTASVGGEVTSNHTHEPTINAEFLPDEVQGCSATGGFPSASDSGQLTVQMVADEDADGGGDGGGSDGGSDGGGSDGDDGNGIPGPGAAGGLAALAAAARAARRD